MVNGEQVTVLFDGDCNLCNGAVSLIRNHDREGRFCLVPLDTAEANEFLKIGGSGGDTLHLLDEDGHHERSRRCPVSLARGRTLA